MTRRLATLAILAASCGYPRPAQLGDDGGITDSASSMGLDAPPDAPTTCDGQLCTDVPAAVCVNATTLRTYSATCAADACAYPSVDKSCGCSNGACATTCSVGCPSHATIASGDDFACAIKTDGTIRCWGDNSDKRASPPSGSFTSIEAGDSAACGVKTDGSLACWGDIATPPTGAFVTVTLGAYEDACALKSDGTVACWGNGLAAPSGTFAQISAGSYDGPDASEVSFACGVKSTGTLACWGDNSNGESDPPSGTFTQVSLGYDVASALKSDGTVALWGTASQTETGNYTQVAAGAGGACGVKSDNTVTCWGPTIVPPTGTFAEISAGGFLNGDQLLLFACGLKSDGTIACRGDNSAKESSPPTGSFQLP